MARVITYKELLRLLSQKVDEPASEGTPYQRLTTDGHGGRAWTGSGSIIAADRVRINGSEYFVRTGEAGAAGFLTIGENTLWLGATPFLLDLGGRSVKQIYKDTSVIYTKPAGPSVLFDNGWVEGISWSGNLLPRRNYTQLGRYDFSFVDTYGYMRIYITQYESNVEYNSHVCTTDPITIPAGATKLVVRMKQNAEWLQARPANFGLLTSDCVNSMDASRGGILSQTIYPSKYEFTEYELPLSPGMAGSSDYRVVINTFSTAYLDSQWYININGVWFE